MRDPLKMVKALAKKAIGRDRHDKSERAYAHEIANMAHRRDRVEALERVPKEQREAVKQHVMIEFERRKYDS